jgi:3-oxoacyl-[acyl-carrier-protein] synthase II
MKRVVVTGIGSLTPIGTNTKEYLQGLQEGRSGAGPITRFDATEFKTQFACELKNFDADERMDRKEARRIDPFSQYALVAADEAFMDSGLDLEKIDLDMAGVIWGSGIGGFRSLEKEIEEHTLGNGIPRYNPFLIPKLIADIAAGHISIKYGFRGINYATVSACASSPHAIANCVDYIKPW